MQPYDVTSSFTRIVDAEPAQAREVIAQIDPMRSLADRLTAPGLDDRALLSDGADDLSYRLLWRFGGDQGNAMLAWRLSVGSDGAGRATLTARLSGRGSNDAARRRLLASWTLLEELAERQTQRLARAIADYDADELEREDEPARPELRVVG
jgi:hypothetical protein